MSNFLDHKDFRLLAEIKVDGTQTLAELAKKTKTSKQFIQYRLKRLEKKGIITGFSAAIDVRMLGYIVFNIFVQLKGDVGNEAEFFNFLETSEEIGYYANTIGNWDVFFAVKAHKVEDFYNFMSKFRDRFGNTILREVVNFEVNSSEYSPGFLSKDVFIPRKKKVHKELTDEEYNVLAVFRKKPTSTAYSISKKTGIHYLKVKKIIQELRKNGLIRSVSATINHEKLNIERHLILLNVATSQESLDFVKSYCENCPNITYSIESIGRWNIILDTYVEDIHSLLNIGDEIRHALAGSINSIEYLRVAKCKQESFKGIIKE